MFKKLKSVFSLEGHEDESAGHFMARMGLYLLKECTEQLITLCAAFVFLLFLIAKLN